MRRRIRTKRARSKEGRRDVRRETLKRGLAVLGIQFLPGEFECERFHRIIESMLQAPLTGNSEGSRIQNPYIWSGKPDVYDTLKNAADESGKQHLLEAAVEAAEPGLYARRTKSNEIAARKAAALAARTHALVTALAAAEFHTGASDLQSLKVLMGPQVSECVRVHLLRMCVRVINILTQSR